MLYIVKGSNPTANIKLIFALPCQDQTKYWKQKDIQFYKELLQEADEIIYTSDHYFSGAMHVRNRWMVDHSSHCLCYLTQSIVGIAYTIDYTTLNGLKIINLAII